MEIAQWSGAHILQGHESNPQYHMSSPSLQQSVTLEVPSTAIPELYCLTRPWHGLSGLFGQKSLRVLSRSPEHCLRAFPTGKKIFD